MRAASLHTGSARSYRGGELAGVLLTKLFQHLPLRIAVRLWNGATLQVGAAAARREESTFTLVFRTPDVVYSTVLGKDPLRLAEAYFRGDLDIEGDFFAALRLRSHLQALQLSIGERLGVMFSAVRLRALNADARHDQLQWSPAHGRTVKAHSKEENRDAIHFHYDVSNEFYALWLDQSMVYSCAYFESPDVDLDAAQKAKLDHICRKLRLQPGDSFLDIGCGWGALVIQRCAALRRARERRDLKSATIDSGAGTHRRRRARGQGPCRIAGLSRPAGRLGL